MRGMTARLHRDASEGLRRDTVLIEISLPGATEELRSARRVVVESLDAFHHICKALQRRWPIGVDGLQRARRHLLDADDERAIDGAAGDRLTREKKCGGTGGAIVVDVDDGNAGETDFVEHRLTAGGVAVDVPGIGLFDGFVT